MAVMLFPTLVFVEPGSNLGSKDVEAVWNEDHSKT